MASFASIENQPARSHYIGVIDLQGGRSVHAVGGLRQRYQPTDCFYPPGKSPVPIEGDYRRLADGYRQIGIDSLYVADLDGIRSDQWQLTEVESIVQQSGGPVVLDLGLRSPLSQRLWDWVEPLMLRNRLVTLVVATECASSVGILDELVNRLSHDRVAVSFDYLSARWLSPMTTESEWIEACKRTRIATVIGLDLASVGATSVEPTESLCRHLRAQLPDARYITGGGIRSETDAHRLLDAGADGLLVASMFAR